MLSLDGPGEPGIEGLELEQRHGFEALVARDLHEITHILGEGVPAGSLADAGLQRPQPHPASGRMIGRGEGIGCT